MTEEREKYIEELLNRFFEGKTTLQEEEELYLFFRSESIPEQWKSYQSLFDYFETGIEKEVNEKKTTGKLVPYQFFYRKVWLNQLVGAAAAILLLVGVNGLFLYDRSQRDLLEGSYIRINGEEWRDPDQIIPELITMASLRMEQEREIERKWQRLLEKEEDREEKSLQLLDRYEKFFDEE